MTAAFKFLAFVFFPLVALGQQWNVHEATNGTPYDALYTGNRVVVGADPKRLDSSARLYVKGDLKVRESLHLGTAQGLEFVGHSGESWPYATRVRIGSRNREYNTKGNSPHSLVFGGYTPYDDVFKPYMRIKEGNVNIAGSLHNKGPMGIGKRGTKGGYMLSVTRERGKDGPLNALRLGTARGVSFSEQKTNWPYDTHVRIHTMKRDKRRNGKSPYGLIFGGYTPIDEKFDPTLTIKKGRVGIGWGGTKRGYKLAIDGSAIAEEVTVEVRDEWPDYVFDKEFDLPSLAEVAQYIEEEGHLPGIPSAAEVGKEGLRLGQMNTSLLQKVEELTLYTITQQKRVSEQRQKLKNQSDVIDQLQKADETQQQQIEKLKRQIDQLAIDSPAETSKKHSRR